MPLNTEVSKFLEMSYSELEERNLDILDKSTKLSDEDFQNLHKEYLGREKKIKAVTVCFSDIEGRFHMLDFDKSHLLKSCDNLTFDGSSIHGFSVLGESDLRLVVDWKSLRFVPADIFGAGKVLVFADILDENFHAFPTDFRGVLKAYLKELEAEKGYIPNAAAEIEGFLIAGKDAEQVYKEEEGFSLISTGGYFHSLPLDTLRQFMDVAAEAQRALGFRNEKDHPEVGPSQFEMNFTYADLVRMADNIQLYKVACRQVADLMGMTATFLPKPIAGINGNGMHTNISVLKNGKNIFFDKEGKHSLSKDGWKMANRLLNHAQELSLIMNPSVNAYRRLDPNFEAPNQIKISAKDRGSMIRIPMGNAKSARLEVRSVSPDANPYLLLLALTKTMMIGDEIEKDDNKRDRVRFLPGTIQDAIRIYRGSDFVERILGTGAKEKYLDAKQEVADRSPKELGKFVKRGEVIYHHEVTNQVLWNMF
jgi:glutamine synthetase